ncbi:hypothetical protein SCHPADRAFT_675173 [Schizopora paradoxa]|uniref:WD40 repeat-like protein n=1 Tax=Schizopora paradoxa TaxID=27342 RepID=A0A0H2R6B8_9AGAM|nr:hypothetical protein SCHPADRAFT_675173 [Schizopora paradoxa]
MAMRKLASLTPLSKQPRLIKFWIGQSDLTLLVISIVAYAVGLAVYVINSQHSVVSIVTCVGAAACTVGIAIVWLHQVLERLLHRRRRKGSTDESSPDDYDPYDDDDDVSNSGTDAGSTHWVDSGLVRRMSNQSSDSGHEGFFGHIAVKIGLTGSSDEQKTIEISDEIVESDSNVYIRHPGAEETDEPEDSKRYISLLKDISKVSNTDTHPFDHFNRGEIAHMRCSPDGKWVAICHQHACIVYDLKNVTKHFVLHADNEKRSAEHAEWAQEGSILLTRTDKELRLWKISRDESDSEALPYEKRYILQTGLCKYVKWLSQREFLVLSDRGTLYRVDYKDGTKEATLLTEPDAKGYQVTQVYPIIPEKMEWIICLGTRSAKLPQDILSDFEVEGDGVDYVLGTPILLEICV